MPLVRAEVRNEYSLGATELYREANKEDPKEILEGVAVAGLVGVLRQLGDLAEFAAEVFHGLQEEVTITSSRSHKLIARVQRVEAALSPLEKAVLAQRSHLHFAYIAGSNWHARIRCEQNHFVYSDVPQFMMDYYENSRGPPRLHLLDRFDPGGPGSCLKRYSDTTFFKRASAASGEVSTERTLKDKKGRKIKKKRSRRRTGEVSHNASFSYSYSGRMHYTQLDAGGHISPSQTASTYDATLRSDLGKESNLHLKNGSGYIEGDFRPSYSVQPDEQESRESISSSVKRHDNEFLDYDFLGEKITDAYDDIHIRLSQEPAGCSSPSVTWDKTRETVEFTTQECDKDGTTQEDDHNRHLKSSSPNLDLETFSDNTVVGHEIVGRKDVQPWNQTVPTLGLGDVHPDDIESETDNFMDALNTIESECETDIDRTKKQEVEHCPKLEDERIDDGACELIRQNLEGQSSCPESNVFSNSSLINGSSGHDLVSVPPECPYANNRSIIGVAAKDEFNSDSIVDTALQSSQAAGESFTSGSLQSVDSRENGNIDAGNNVESVSCALASNFRDGRSRLPTIDGTGSSPEPKKHAPEISSVTSVTFWTNGGLLGLQPSKPPDCSVLNGAPRDTVYKKDGEISSSIQRNIEEGLDTDSSTCHDDQERGTSFQKISWKIPSADLDIKLKTFGDSLHHNNASSTGSSVAASASCLPVHSASQAVRKHQENCRNSSRMFELSNRLLSTGSNKKLLPGGDENSNVAGYQNVNTFEQKNRRSVANRTFSGRSKGILLGDSPTLSPSSSPPLQHMKVSFQPIDRFETSKLKLKFPGGNSISGNGSDIYPSFQLVPEVSITRHNVGSDSDADTFYRSSPSLSDDCRSNHSESNSEQWESSESLNSKDRDLYDALRRISLTESVSTAPENGRRNHEDIHDNCGLQFPFVENGMQISESCPSFNHQSVDTANHSFRKELINDTIHKNLVEAQFAQNHAPAPPPLPPVQWRDMTPHLDGIEDRCEAMSEGSYYAFNHMLTASAISEPKPAPFNEDQIDTTKLQKSKKSSSEKSNGLREANQGKSIDETDFLHQIRTKSFSLRPTATAKPTVPSGVPATVQVTAILEKANAIRQAVGSDGEDDGNWSDT